MSYGQKRHVSKAGTPRAQGIPLNEVTYALKTKQKINQKTNMSESEDVLSLARLERQGLVPSFLIYHSKYKFWVLTPP